MNGIQVYQSNNLNFTVNITADQTVVLSGFTPLMRIDFLTGTTIVTGSTITNGITLFSITSTINNVEPYVYQYEVYIKKGLEEYTIIQDSYSVLPSLINN